MQVGLGTDIGGGTSFSLLATMGAAYEIAQLGGRALSAVEAFYLATLGGARALALDDRIGSLAPGHEADFAVLDPKATPLLALRNARAESVEDVVRADDASATTAPCAPLMWRASQSAPTDCESAHVWPKAIANARFAQAPTAATLETTHAIDTRHSQDDESGRILPFQRHGRRARTCRGGRLKFAGRRRGEVRARAKNPTIIASA